MSQGKKHFNLVDDRWIPVTTINMNIERLSLMGLFTRRDVVEFEGDSIEKYALLRFCGAIAQSSNKCQPSDILEFKNLRNTYSEYVVEYLQNNRDLFWMDGDKPFMQTNTKTETDGKDKQVELQLREKYACGNNTIVYQKQYKKQFTIEEIVLDLIVHQVFSVTFGKTGAVPSRALMYATSPKGNINIYAKLDNLLDSIWYNMKYGVVFGKPVWETRFSEKYINTALNKQVPLTVRISISDDLKTMSYSKGLPYSENIDDTTNFIQNKEKFQNIEVQRPMSTSSSNRFWKDFEAVISAETGTIVPKILEARRLKLVDNITINTIGYELKASMGLYSTVCVNTSSYSIKDPAKIETDEFKEAYVKSCKLATDICTFIKKSLNSALYSHITVTKKNSKLYRITNKLMTIFENELDLNSNVLFEMTNNIDINKWKTIIRNAIHGLIDNVEEHHGIVASFALRNNEHMLAALSELKLVKEKGE